MKAEVAFGGIELNLDAHADWQKSLTCEKKKFKEPNSEQAVSRRKEVLDRQTELIAAVEAGPAAAKAYLLGKALSLDASALASADDAVPKLSPFTPGEMGRLPIHAERELARMLHGHLIPSQAAEPAVWVLCHAVWMGDGAFGADLAAVFLDGTRADTPERRTRNLLRRTGGLRHIRGNTSPLVDCPISAAWWRSRVANRTSEIAGEAGEPLSADDAHRVLWNTEVWSNLVMMSLRQVTAVCAPRARAAAVAALHRCGVTQGQKAVRAQTQGAIRALGRLSYGHNLTETHWRRLVEVAAEGAAGAAAEAAEEGAADSDAF